MNGTKHRPCSGRGVWPVRTILGQGDAKVSKKGKQDREEKVAEK